MFSSRDSVHISQHVEPSIENIESIDDNVHHALNIANQIIETANLDISQVVKNLPSTSDDSKGVKNLYVPFDEAIYKNLVELAIKDDDIPIREVPKLKKTNKPKPKDPKPLIENYRKPVVCPVKIFQAKSEPPTKEMILKHNYKEVYERDQRYLDLFKLS